MDTSGAAVMLRGTGSGEALAAAEDIATECMRCSGWVVTCTCLAGKEGEGEGGVEEEDEEEEEEREEGQEGEEGGGSKMELAMKMVV